jgi:IS30 family transposase
MEIGYHHLTYDIGCQIFTLLQKGLSQNATAKQLKISQSTVSRELSKNSGNRGYRFKQAHEQVKIIEDNLNNRPRKTLQFQTPNKKYF